MNLARYLEIRQEVLSYAKKVEDDKRQSYTAGHENVLRNFESDAEFVGSNQLQNCFTHTMKQVRGISSFVQHPDVKPSESLLSRAADLINYAVLMVANAHEMGRETGIKEDFIKIIDDSDSAFATRDQILKRFNSTPSRDHTIIHDTWPRIPVDPTKPAFSFVALANGDTETAKILNDYYTYTFGEAEEPYKD